MGLLVQTMFQSVVEWTASFFFMMGSSGILFIFLIDSNRYKKTHRLTPSIYPIPPRSFSFSFLPLSLSLL